MSLVDEVEDEIEKYINEKDLSLLDFYGKNTLLWLGLLSA